jgi:hypothetical protein
MPLFDAYDKPIEPQQPIEPTPNQQLTANSRIIKELIRLRLRWQGLRPFWKRLIELVAIASAVATLYWGLVGFRQDISVDPYVSYDSSDAFNERFSIINNGPFSIYDVRYACAVTYLEALPPMISDSRAVTVMMPTASPIPVIHWKEKSSTDCDYIARLGPNLTKVHIEIEVLYRRWFYPWSIHGPGWKFSAKRDTAGKFDWDYGSKDDGIFEGKGRVLILMPFNSECAPFDPNLFFNNYKEFALMARKFGHKIIAATLIDCGKPN